MNDQYNNQEQDTQTEQSTEIQESHNHSYDQNENTVETKGETGPQESWRELRTKQQQLDEQNRYLMEQNKYLMQQLNAQLPQKQEEPQFDINSLPDDDFATTQHIKQTNKQYQDHLRRLEERQVMLDMRDKYDDFKKVCSNENLKKLAQEEPAFAETILMNPSLEKQWDLAYKAIKRSDFYQRSMKHNPEKHEEDEIAQNNMYRPKPSSAAKTSQHKSALGAARSWSRMISDQEKAEQFRKAQAIANGELTSY